MYHRTLLLLLLLLCPKLNSGPMHDAIKKGNLSQVQALFEQDSASINHLSKEEKLSPLHCCVIYDQYEIAEFLLEQKGYIEVDIQGQKLSTPLHVAASENKVSFIKLLLKNKADANVANIVKNTPLMLAIDRRHTESAKILLPKSNIHQTNKAKISAFAKAAEKNNITLMQELYDRGAAVDQESNTELTSLIIACHRGDVAVVQFLLNTQKVDIDKFTKSGFCPLRAAIVGKNFDVLELLLEAGANPEVRNPLGDTLLHTAADKGDLETVEIVSKYANINAQNNVGNTPIHVAAMSKKLSIMRHLLSHGARTDIKNKDGHIFWGILKSDPRKNIYIKSCQAAQREYKALQDHIRVISALPTSKTKPITASNKNKKEQKPKPSTSKKKRRREKKKLKVSGTLGKVSSTLQQKKDVACQYFRAAKNVITPAPDHLDPNLLRIWPQISTRVGPQKPRIAYRKQTPTMVTQRGVFHETPYSLDLFNCFESNPTLAREYAFTHGIDYSRFYSHEIEERLSLIQNLERDNLEHLLIKDTNAPIPTLTSVTGYLNQKYKNRLLHPKIGQKLDLYHLIDFSPDLITRLGITFEKTKEDGFKTIEVRIPGKLTFDHNNSEKTQDIVLELSFKYKNGTVGECIHRFARPIEQVKEQVVLRELATFKQKYLSGK